MKGAMFLRLLAMGLLFHVPLVMGAESKSAPAFVGKTLAGKAFTFEPSKIVKPTLLVFWATWCPNCIQEMPALKELHRQRNKEVDIIGISIDTDVEKPSCYAKDEKIDFPMLQDSGEKKLSDLFGITKTPTLIVVDQQGKIKKTTSRVQYAKPALLELVKPKKSVTRDAVLMATPISLVVLGDDEKKANLAIDEALIEMKRIEDLMTDWRESELMNINHQAGKKPVKVNPEIIFLLQEARKASDLSAGAYDVTYAGAGGLWHFDAGAIPPDDAEIKKRLPLIGYKDLILDPKEQTAFLKKKGMKIGLGGIAKGYAVDKAAEILEKHGFFDYAVNGGGDLLAHGLNNGRLWNVSLQHPRDKDKNYAVIPVSNGSVATSGDSERFFTHNGKRYAHIIDPRTGYPADKCQSVTILAKKAYWADALATGVFVLGPIEGMKVINKLEGVEGIIVDAEGKVQVSKGLQAPPQDG